jgi:hypothetical protein
MNAGQIVEDPKQKQLAKDQSYREFERMLDIKHREAAIKMATGFAKTDSNYLWYFLQSYISRKVELTDVSTLLALNALEQNYKTHHALPGANGDTFVVHAITLLIEANKNSQTRY